MKNFILYSIVVLILLSAILSCQKRKGEPEESSIEKRIYDNVHLLTAVQKLNLYELINNLEKEVGSQIAIVIVNTLGGKSIEEFALD